MKSILKAFLIGFSISFFSLGCSLNWDILDADQTDSDSVAPDNGDNDVPFDGPCPDGLTDCSGACVDLSSDHGNCGGCGNACMSAEVCNEGACTLECPSEKENCDGSCVSTSDDVANCGNCGNVCPPAENAEPVCLSGWCTTKCMEGWSDMDGNGSCETNCVPSPGGEVCNGLDDDCDGTKDEGFPCQIGQNAAQGCGNCGTQTRTCSAGCDWGSWGTCSGEGECSPGQTRDQGCGMCGRQSSTCDGSCHWGSWGSCNGEGVCRPNETGTESCTPCGQRSRTCGGNCQWGSWGSCTGQDCNPGDTQNCGTCGIMTCDSTCHWGACGNDGGTIWRRCNECGWQYCNPAGSSWYPCEGHFSCTGGESCDSSGWCNPPP